MTRYLLLAGVLLALAQTSSAQPSKVPTIAASAAAAADWATTYVSLQRPGIRETNPLLQPWQGKPGELVTVGALFDVGGVTAWNLTVGKRHQKVAAAGLWAMAGFRSYLAIHNIRNMQKVGRIGQ